MDCHTFGRVSWPGHAPSGELRSRSSSGETITKGSRPLGCHSDNSTSELNSCGPATSTWSMSDTSFQGIQTSPPVSSFSSPVISPPKFGTECANSSYMIKQPVQLENNPFSFSCKISKKVAASRPAKNFATTQGNQGDEQTGFSQPRSELKTILPPADFFSPIQTAFTKLSAEQVVDEKTSNEKSSGKEGRHPQIHNVESNSWPVHGMFGFQDFAAKSPEKEGSTKCKSSFKKDEPFDRQNIWEILHEDLSHKLAAAKGKSSDLINTEEDPSLETDMILEEEPVPLTPLNQVSAGIIEFDENSNRKVIKGETEEKEQTPSEVQQVEGSSCTEKSSVNLENVKDNNSRGRCESDSSESEISGVPHENSPEQLLLESESDDEVLIKKSYKKKSKSKWKVKLTDPLSKPERTSKRHSTNSSAGKELSEDSRKSCSPNSPSESPPEADQTEDEVLVVPEIVLCTDLNSAPKSAMKKTSGSGAAKKMVRWSDLVLPSSVGKFLKRKIEDAPKGGKRIKIVARKRSSSVNAVSEAVVTKKLKCSESNDSNQEEKGDANAGEPVVEAPCSESPAEVKIADTSVSPDNKSGSESADQKRKKRVSVAPYETKTKEEGGRQKSYHHCVFCEAKFPDKSSVLEHAREVHKHRCNLCRLHFPTKNDADEHKKTHSTNRETFLCDICDKRFKTKDQHEKHLKTPLHREIEKAIERCLKKVKKEQENQAARKPFSCSVPSDQANVLSSNANGTKDLEDKLPSDSAEAGTNVRDNW